MNVSQNLIFQNLPNPCRLIVDKHGFLNLIPLSPEEVIKSREPVPCTPGEILDVVVEQCGSEKFKDREIIDEYTLATNPWRITDKKGTTYLDGFYEAAQQWLKDNGIDFDVFTAPKQDVHEVTVHIDPTGRQIDGNIRYLVEFAGTPLYIRRYGKLSDGKPNELYNLDELYAKGLLERPAEGKVYKTNALGVQCARLNLSAIQNLMSDRKEPEHARFG